MSGSLYDPNNVVVGQAVLWLAPWVAGSLAVPPADATALFDASAWTSPWFGAGATHEGFKINVDVSTTTITIEEQSVPVDEKVESKAIAIEAALAEDTLTTIGLSWGGGTVVTVAAATGITPKKTMALSDDLAYYTVALETRNYLGKRRLIYIPKTSVSGSGDTNFRRAADKRTYPVRVASICKPSDIVVTDITGVALP